MNAYCSSELLLISLLLHDFFLQEGRQSEADFEKEICLASPFNEIHRCVLLSEKVWSGKADDSIKDRLGNESMTNIIPVWQSRWKMRLQEKTPPAPLADIELHTLSVLLEKPRERDAFIQAIFESGLSVEVELARFKRLLARLREKLPNLIEFEEGHYRIRPNPDLRTSLVHLI